MAQTLLNANQTPAITRTLLVSKSYPFYPLLEFQNSAKAPWADGNIPFHFEITFRTPAASAFGDPNPYCCIFGGTDNSDGKENGMKIIILNAQAPTPSQLSIYVGLSSNGSSYDICDQRTDYVIKPFTYYTVKVTYDLSKYIAQYKEGFNGTYSTIKETTSSSPLYHEDYVYPTFGSSNYNQTWNGTAIDLEHTFAKSGNTVYFDGKNMLADNNYEVYMSQVNIIKYTELV